MTRYVSGNNESDINNNYKLDRMSNPSQAKLSVKKQQLKKKSQPELRKSTRKLFESGRKLTVLLLDKKDIEDDLRAIQTSGPYILATPLAPSPPAATHIKTSRASKTRNFTS